MKFSTLCYLYCEARQLSQAYAKNLDRTARRLDEQKITSESICGAELSRMLKSMSTLSPTSRKNFRREALTLWRFAYDSGISSVPPGRVAPVIAPVQPAEAWSLEEVRSLLACAEGDRTLVGGHYGMRVCDYMPAWIRIGYETALRHADILNLHATEIRRNCVCKIASKTSKPLVRRISDRTNDLIQDLIRQSDDRTVFAWFLTRRRSFTCIRDFLDRHGVSGSGKFLRRTAATLIADSSPALATRYLQHSDPKLLKHYVDETLLKTPDGPPPID